MATTLNMVTVGNDFVLRVKVGMVQYSNNSVQWDYMDLTTCRNIVFNISCTKHDIDINLPYTIDQTDHAVISATVRAEMLHANSIYNFSITGIDSAGYRWTYISPKQQSFITTNVSQDSANAYTELAFTAGMIMPLASPGKDGFTPYIGPNNNWWINGEDTGVSAIADIDLTDYATKEYVDDAIENIPVTDEMIDGNTNYIRGNIAFDGGSTWYILSNNYDFATQISVTIPNGLDTGIELADDIKVEIRFSVGMEMPGPAYSTGYCPLFAQSPIDDYIYFRMGIEGDHCQVIINNNQYNFNAVYNTGGDINYNDRIYTYGATLAYGFIDGRQASDYSTASLSWETAMAQRSETDIHFVVPFNLYQYIYNIKFYKNNVLIANMVPVSTQNGDGFHDEVRDIDIVSPYMKFCKRNSGYYTREFTQQLINNVNDRITGVESWNTVNQIYEHYDCSQPIDKILNGDTITTGWDIQNLWECSFNHDVRKAQPVYKNSPISWYIDKDDNNQTSKTYYRFWNRDDGLYYNVTVQWTYPSEGSRELDENVISTSFTTEEYATTAYVTSAVSGITPGGGGGSVDLTGYATEAYVTNAIENIDIPEVDLTYYYTKSETDAEITYAIENIEIPVTDEMIDGNTNYIRGNIAFDGYWSWYILNNNYDFATQISVTIPNGLDTGIELADDIKVEIRFSVGMEMPGPAYGIGCCPLFAQSPIDDYIYFRMGIETDHCQVMINNNQYNFNAVYNTGGDINYNDRIYTYGATLAYGFIDGRQASDYSTASLSWETAMAQRSETDIHFVVPFNLYQYIYNIKFYKNNVLIANMVPVSTQNGDGFHDEVRDIDIVSPYMKFCKRNSGYYTREFTQQLINNINDRISGLDSWGPVNQIYEHYDCSQPIDKILNGDTITTGWDIQNLWECSFNHDVRKAQPVYKNSPISWYIDKDDNNQTLKTYYRFWNRDDGLYYNVIVQWTYLGDDTGSGLLDHAILSTTFTTEEYATTAYVTAAVSGITPGGGGGSVDLTGYATEAYVTNAIENIDFTPYVTNSYLTAYYSTTDDILTEVDTTISDVTTVEGEQWVKHDYQLMRYECNRIRFYDYLYSNSQPVTCYGFKIGIINEENVDLYNITANSTFDDEVEVHTWYRMIPQGTQLPIHYDYVYDSTSVESDNSIRYNYSIQDGEDEFGHYIDITLIDDGNDGIVYFGPKVSDVTKGSNYTNEIDGQTITITNNSGSSLIIPTIKMVEHGYLLDFVYGSITAAENINNWLSQLWANNKFATKTDLSNYVSWDDYDGMTTATLIDLSGVTLQLVTETQYNEHITNDTGMQNTLYIIVDDNDINVVKQMRVYRYHWDPTSNITPAIDGYSGWNGESDDEITDSSWDSTPFN